MSERPNWGWGEHQPVPMFTETEIRKVMEVHHPTGDHRYGEPLCCCSTKVGVAGYTDFTEDHLVEQLKEYRHGCQETQYPHATVGGTGDAPSSG